MALPSLTPSSTSSKSILPSTGSTIATADGSGNASNYPIGLYTTGGDLENTNFMSGAADQVAYVFKKLGGDVLDIELTPANVYSAYEESVLEYSYQINLHQSKNMLSNVLGQSTASFDHEGQMTGRSPYMQAVNFNGEVDQIGQIVSCRLSEARQNSMLGKIVDLKGAA